MGSSEPSSAREREWGEAKSVVTLSGSTILFLRLFCCGGGVNRSGLGTTTTQGNTMTESVCGEGLCGQR